MWDLASSACPRCRESGRSKGNAGRSLHSLFFAKVVTSEAHPYSPQARARRRFLYRRPVRSRDVAVLAQRLQQCSFSFFSCTCCTLGLVCGIPREASARSRETDSSQARYRFNGLGRGVPSQQAFVRTGDR
ncbi:hypothetical protein Taro_023826, partial [Colocasia esculenta]|nr:hypothetical protein [Colocasia esculenta]